LLAANGLKKGNNIKNIILSNYVPIDGFFGQYSFQARSSVFSLSLFDDAFRDTDEKGKVLVYPGVFKRIQMRVWTNT
jgi:hypothetical protein